MKISTRWFRSASIAMLLGLSLCLSACDVPSQIGQPGRAQVEAVSVQILESFPVQVHVLVSGSLPDRCTVIDRIDQRFDGEESIFWVEIVTARTGEDACTQALVPFEETVPLDVYGLPAGNYGVEVDGVRGTFTLEVDNSPPEAGLPNPASQYCEEQGYMLEIRTDEEGSQYGVCIFPDGSECDEWAFFRGECGPDASSEDTSPSGSMEPGLPNPASQYCEEQGYTLEIRTDEEGNQYGVCIFPDGSECDEWAYFRGECGPAVPSEDTGSVPADWATYTHGRFGYQFSYPPDATLREEGIQGFPTDELPEGETADAYVAELEEAYGDALCVGVGYGLGYVNFSAPINQGFRYAICGRTGVGAGEMIDKSDTIVVAGRSYTAGGFEFIGEEQPCDALSCHNETFVLQLADGTRIEYGAAPSDASYDDYLATTRDVLLQIVASFVPGE